MRQLLVLDSKYRINPEDKEHSYKFKLSQKVRFNSVIRLEQFIFQNSQYVFNAEKKSNKFIYTESGESAVPKTVTFEGMFDNTDAFVKKFNEVMNNNSIPVRMTYSNILYEIKIQHPNGVIFSLEEFYVDGGFMDLIGYKRINQGQNVYTNANVPKLFSQRLIYIYQCLK